MILNYPELKAVVDQHVLITEHIPQAARLEMALTWNQMCFELCHANSVESWTDYHMLAKCLLWKPSRAGKGKKKLANLINERCRIWRGSTGDSKEQRSNARLHLWKLVPKAIFDGSAKSKLKAAIKRARQGRYGDATRALVNEGMAPFNEETLAKLKSKPRWKTPCNSPIPSPSHPPLPCYG